MKKQQILSMLMLALALVCSCVAFAQTRAKTKTVARTAMSDKTSQAMSAFIMTEDGLDDVKLGMNYKDLPSSVAGLYDSFSVSGGDDTDAFDCYSITFLLKGDCWLSALAKKTGEIWQIHVDHKRVKAKIGDTLIGVGSKFSTLKKLPGAKTGEFEGQIVIGKFKFTQDIGMEEMTDHVAYFDLEE